MDFEDYDFEEWEDDANLIEEEDWVGLLKLRRARAEKSPTDLCAQQCLAEALVLNKKYPEAIAFLKPLYFKHEGSGFGIHEILDALYGLGKMENDFDWITKPTILKLDLNTLNLCIKLLKGKRKHMRVVDIYLDLLLRVDYVGFDEEKLTKFLLQNSNIFDIKGNDDFLWRTELKLKKL
jgi:hypothetical protein